MNGERGGGRRAGVSAGDRALWIAAVRDVTPLQPGEEDVAAAPSDAPSDTAPAVRGAAGAPAPVPPPPVAPHPSRAPPITPPLTGLDRRTRQRLSRGQAEFEARLDLHGMSLDHARMALARFLARSSETGHRLVLVITGKGASPIARHTLHGMSHFDAPERQGRLRRKLPEWLAEDDLRPFVAGYQPAHPRHGGGGAFYVRLRRRERGKRAR